MHAVQAMQCVLTGLAPGKVDFAGKGVGFEEYKSIVGFEHRVGRSSRSPRYFFPHYFLRQSAFFAISHAL